MRKRPNVSNPITENQKMGMVTTKRRFYNLENGKNKAYWDCECECGNTIAYREDYLRQKEHAEVIRSCGCYKRQRIGKISPTWRGYQEISLQYFKNLQKRGIDRGYCFEITIEQMWEQYIKQNKKCALTGIDIVIKQSTRTNVITDPIASLDRIDSTKGYTVDNIQWVHKDVNLIKNHFSEETFFNYVKLIYEFKHLEELPHIRPLP